MLLKCYSGSRKPSANPRSVGLLCCADGMRRCQHMYAWCVVNGYEKKLEHLELTELCDSRKKNKTCAGTWGGKTSVEVEARKARERERERERERTERETIAPLVKEGSGACVQCTVSRRKFCSPCCCTVTASVFAKVSLSTCVPLKAIGELRHY